MGDDGLQKRTVKTPSQIYSWHCCGMENTMVLDLEVSWTRSFTIFTHLHLMIMRHDRDVDTHLGCVADLFTIIMQVSSALGRHKIPRERTVSETCCASLVLTIRVRACGLVWNYCTNVVVTISVSRRLQRYKDPPMPLQSLPTSFPAFCLIRPL